MSTAVQFVPERGEIRVGGTAFDCVAAPDGALVVRGHHVHPVTLGVRDRLVAFTADDEQRARRISRLIGDAAMRSGDGDVRTADDLRAAIEAVALHLAGAELPGALARTTLLVTRAIGGFGEAATALPAAEADRLAEMLEATLPAAGGTSPDDSGWMTISYDATAEGGNPDGPFAARDHLAALLLTRDRPISDVLAALLLGAPPVADRASIVDEQDDPAADAVVAAIDRWAQAPSPLPTEATYAGRWAPSQHAGGSAANGADTRDLPSDAGHQASVMASKAQAPMGVMAAMAPTPAPTAELHHLGRGAAIAPVTPGAWWPVRRPQPRDIPPEPAGGLDRTAGPGPSAHTSLSTTTNPGEWRETGVGITNSPRLASRPAHAANPFDEPGARAAPRPDPGGWPRLGAAGATLDLDAIAIALHRAADLRGIG